MNLVILLPAAGASRRMAGVDKLLEPVDGEHLLTRQARRAAATGARVLVTLPPDRPERRAALAGLAVVPVIVRDPAAGMSASLRAALPHLGAAEGLMILPPDMPDIATCDITRMIAAFHAAPVPRPILRATAETGDWGHPVILPQRHFAAIAGLTGDQGARAILLRHPADMRPFPLPGDRATTDLDTPQAWADWRASRASRQKSSRP